MVKLSPLTRTLLRSLTKRANNAPSISEDAPESNPLTSLYQNPETKSIGRELRKEAENTMLTTFLAFEDKMITINSI